MNHTPGPWEAGKTYKFTDSPDFFAVIFSPAKTGKFHTPRSGQAYGVDNCECTANAHLIAAAPELLDACKAIIDAGIVTEHNGLRVFSGDFQSYDDAMRAMRDAIAKAEGE